MALTWTTSDGTRVSLGGNVAGESQFAKAARTYAAMASDGIEVDSGAGPIPDVVPLKLDDPTLVDAWLSRLASIHGLTVTERPEFERTERTESDDESDEPPAGELSVF